VNVTILALTLNEIDGVRAVLPKIDRSWYDQLIVVDGNSTDGTIQWCRDNGYDVYVQVRRGIRHAYLEVLPQVRGDIVLTLSPDGNCDPHVIPAILDKMREGFDMVIGSRYVGDATSDDDDLVTGFGNWLFTRTVNLLHGARYTDCMVIYRAFRRQLIQDYRDLLGSEEERQAYDQMIALAHRVFPYVEGHKFYCEHWYTNLFFNKIREFGSLLAAHGFFAHEDDVFQLTHYEVEAAIIDLMTSWSNGSPPRGPERWPQIVSERRAAIAEWAKHSTPPALGPVPDVIDDPAIVMLWGITRESLESWLRDASGGDSRELRGFAASSGVVEGPACVVKSVEEIARVRQGDILVCQITNPTWAPIFQKIAGAVSDIGGSMSHAAIVAREYGLPAVVGTGTATSRIKDGQRIRVDGGRGVVTILA